jgi:uncharacterized protein YgbK (DUF1537 family)
LQFFASHTRTHVLPDVRNAGSIPAGQTDHSEDQVWSINTSSRHSNPQEAQALTRKAVALCRDRFGVDNFYKKIDSTLRGHIAQECLGMLEEMKAQCAVIVPAYPQEGRRTVGGYQLVRGIPVEKTVVARDPLFPIRQSHLPTLLELQTKPGMVGYIPLSVVLHGAGPILVKLNDLIKDGKKLVVVSCPAVPLGWPRHWPTCGQSSRKKRRPPPSGKSPASARPRRRFSSSAAATPTPPGSRYCA